MPRRVAWFNAQNWAQYSPTISFAFAFGLARRHHIFLRLRLRRIYRVICQDYSWHSPLDLIMSKQCIVCEKTLTGTRRKFCSNACNCRYKYKENKTALNKGTYKCQKSRALRRKIEIINKAGGKCQRCGYNRNLAALQFHHKDPTKKIFKLDARSLSGTVIESIYEEFKKCELLCANCHAETHYPDLDNLL